MPDISEDELEGEAKNPVKRDENLGIVDYEPHVRVTWQI